MPVVGTRPPARPAVRLRPVPPLDPPFDDEYPPAPWVGGPATPGTLAQWTGGPAGPVVPGTSPSWTGGPAAPVVPGTPASWTGGPAGPGGPGRRPGSSGAGPLADGPGSGPGGRGRAAGGRPGPTALAGPPVAGSAPARAVPLSPDALVSAAPEAMRAVRRFVDTCLEIFNGYRPAAHVRPLANPAEAAAIVQRISAGAARISGRHRPRRPAPGVRLRRLRVCEPRPGAAEVAAVVGTAGRAWAVAFRLERRRGSWVGVSIEVL